MLFLQFQDESEIVIVGAGKQSISLETWQEEFAFKAALHGKSPFSRLPNLLIMQDSLGLASAPQMC